MQLSAFIYSRGALALLCLFVINASAALATEAHPAPSSQVSAGTQSVAAELSNAARDKRAFVVAASMLGATVKGDIALLEAMTGAAIEQQAKDIPFRDAPKRYEASGGFLAHDRIISNFGYLYSFRSNGEYFSIIRFRLDQAFNCLRLEDLTSVLGSPKRFVPAPASAGAKPRQNAVWAVEYELPSAANAAFIFGHAECASSLNVAVNLN